MHVVVGGAYAGKRKIVRERYPSIVWLSGYAGHSLKNWKSFLQNGSTLVIEGWEVWVKEELRAGKSMQEVKDTLFSMVDEMVESADPLVFIMLESGRGIVPMEKENREWRDLLGWLLQKMAAQADTVTYCWHGLARTIKGDESP